jgi:hypothetical protein
MAEPKLLALKRLREIVRSTMVNSRRTYGFPVLPISRVKPSPTTRTVEQGPAARHRPSHWFPRTMGGGDFDRFTSSARERWTANR